MAKDSKISKLKTKLTPQQISNHYGETRDGSTINNAKRLNTKINKNNLNTLKMGSHRMGRVKSNFGNITVIDSIDDMSYKTSKRVVTQTGVIGYKELSYLRNDEEIEWVTLSEEDYTTQLLYQLSTKERPKRIINSGGKVFLDPKLFVDLVKLQETKYNTKLTVSFNRSTSKLKHGELNVLVQNVHNLNADRSDYSVGKDDNKWRERESFSGPAGTFNKGPDRL